MWVVAALATFSLTADAQSVVLHEYVPSSPNDDLEFAATTLDGELPAALQTESGLVTAPDPRRPPEAEHVYSGVTTDDGPGSTYQPDRDTRRPNVEGYDDPFSPSTAPFKRLRAYDQVEPDYTLSVRVPNTATIEVGGEIGPTEEPFYADMTVDLLEDTPVRLPSVGPDSRPLKVHINPEVDFSLLKDGADNWFIKSSERKRVRLVMHIAMPRASFGSEFADIQWVDLEPFVHPQPEEHRGAFEQVAARIGVSREMRPKEALSRLVQYFRAFHSTEDRLDRGSDIYLDLCLSQKGVCRHRSFGFLVTALHLGLPARMIVNEAHAWVEVYDTQVWHRIDLGGAALSLDQQVDPSRPPHLPPEDPHAWPEGAEETSGQGLGQSSRQEALASQPESPDGTDESGPPQSDESSSQAPSDTPHPSPPKSAPDTRPVPVLRIGSVDQDAVRRGNKVTLNGKISNEGKACDHVRVDVKLTAKQDETRRGPVTVGSLSTDADGNFSGSVVVPRDFAPGEYDLMVSTPGDAECGAGASDAK